MAIAHVLQENFVDLQPFNPPENPDQETDALTPRKNPRIEKWLGQLSEKGLFGRPYVKDYLYDQKRRNCRPNTIRNTFVTLRIFLSFLKE